MLHQGAHVLVTGGTSGIGAAIAAAYAADGAHVTITGTRPSPADYDDDLSAYRYLQLDVENRENLLAVAARMDQADVLVNNAATALGPTEWEPDVFERAVNMHLNSAYRL